jgi:peptidoglycan/LPS O-acetylase OafA/YrhL
MALGGASPAEPELARVPALDGLRGLAVAGVVLFHGGVTGAGGGFLGVSTFFTLSGFLITSLLLVERERTGRIDLARFWARRARRLLPALLVAIAAVIALGALIATGQQAARLPGDALSALLYVANWRFVAGDQSYAAAFSDPSLVQHCWSLAIEEQFYVLFPLLAVGVLARVRAARSGLAAVLGALLVASVLLSIVLADPAAEPARVYYGTDTRAAEMLLGALLACLIGGRPLAISRAAARRVAGAGTVALVALLAGWIAVDLHTPLLYQGGLAGYGLLTASVIAAAHVRGPVARALSWAPLRGLGLVSYGVYLFHWPIFLWLTPARTGVDGAALLGIRVAVTLTVALVSFHLVEQPVAIGVLAAAVALVPIGEAAPRIVFAPVRAASPARVAPTPSLPPTPSLELAAAGARPAELPATGGAPARPVQRIMIVGDSVAQTLGRGLERWGPPQGVSVLNAARFWCAIVRGGEIGALLGHRASPRCETWAEQWGADLDRFQPDVVVVLSTIWDLTGRRRPEWGPEFLAPGDARFDDRLLFEWRDAVRLLSSRGARVVWLSDPCAANPDLAPYLRYANDHYLPALAARGVETVDLDAHVCPGGGFSDTIDGTAGARPDGLHFSDPGADATARWLGPLLVTAEPDARVRS